MTRPGKANMPIFASRRILVVEDEYLIASEIEACLLRAGAEVDGPWPNVKFALASLDQGGRLDAAILDVNLGHGELAYPIAERLDQLAIPYLFATGNTRGLEALPYTAHLWLEKPITDERLLKALGDLIVGRVS
jgi:CheY-like chemotaxis protein